MKTNEEISKRNDERGSAGQNNMRYEDIGKRTRIVLNKPDDRFDC